MPKKGSLKTPVPPTGEKVVTKDKNSSLEQEIGHEIDEIFPSKKKRKNETNKVRKPKENPKKPSLEQKKPGNEIDEIFSSNKKTDLDEEENSSSKRENLKKRSKASESGGFVDPPSRSRRKTNDGLPVYSAEELGISKSDAEGVMLLVKALAQQIPSANTVEEARTERDEVGQPSSSAPQPSIGTLPHYIDFPSSSTVPPPISVPRSIGENGAPPDQSLLTSYRFHIASKVWNDQGVRYPIEVHNRQSSMKSWDFSKGCEYVRNVVRDAGLQQIVDYSHITLDRALINAVVERWFPEPNAFHLPFGEMTITGDDVENILGLRMSGSPMTGPTVKSYEENVQLVMTSFGITYEEAHGEMKNKKKVSFKWLRERFMKSFEHDNIERKEACARAALLHIIGTGLCPDKTGIHIKVHFLTLLANLDTVGQVSWGSGVLTHLYRELGAASRYDSKTITGCMTLLQTWIYEHFPTLRNGRGNALGGYQQNQPRMCRWEALSDRARLGPTVRSIRESIDNLTIDKVIWEPYNDHRDKYPLNEMSFYIGLMVCFDISEPIYPDRVLRQFGRVQTVPCAPISTMKVRTGSNASTYKCFYNPGNWYWQNWEDHVIRNNRRSTLAQQPGQCSLDYMGWYLNAGHPRALNPENMPEPPRSSVHETGSSSEFICGAPPTGKFKHRLAYLLNILKCGGELDRLVSLRRTIARAVNLLENYEDPDDLQIFGEIAGGEVAEAENDYVKEEEDEPLIS